MIGITIGIGEKYRFYAEEASKRFTHFTGLPAIILTEEHLNSYKNEEIIKHGNNIAEKSFYLKFFMFDIVKDDSIFYFDSDYCMVDNWQPHKTFDGRFTGVKDRTKWMYENDIIYCDISRYCNAGMYMVARDTHKTLFEKCRKHGSVVRKTFHDQCLLNLYLQLDKYPIRYLDRRYNCMNFDGVLKTFDLKAIHNSNNYPVYEENGFREGTKENILDTIMMAGLSGPITVVFEDRKQKGLFLHPDGTTQDGNVWFINQHGQMYVCENYIHDVRKVIEIYETP